MRGLDLLYKFPRAWERRSTVHDELQKGKSDHKRQTNERKRDELDNSSIFASKSRKGAGAVLIEDIIAISRSISLKVLFFDNMFC